MRDSKTEADAGADDRYFPYINVTVQMEDHQIQVNSGRRTEFVFPIEVDAEVCIVLRSRSGIGVGSGQCGSLVLNSSVQGEQRKRFARLSAVSEAVSIDDVAHRDLIVEDAGGEIDRNLGNVAADAVSHPESNERHLRKTSDGGYRHVADGRLCPENVAYRQLRNGNGENACLELSVLEMVFQTRRRSRHDSPDALEK